MRTVYGSCFSEAVHVPGAKEKLRMLLLGVSEVASTIVTTRSVAISSVTARMYPWINQVIPCGVDSRRFGGGRSDERSQDPTILFVGTYKNRKRGRLLADVFARDILRGFRPRGY